VARGAELAVLARGGELHQQILVKITLHVHILLGEVSRPWRDR
jgi:hypothetical protein